MISVYGKEIFSLTLIALAIGMDSFSVSLGMGMQALRLKRIALIGIVFGLLHMLMPFFGIILGKIIFQELGQFAILVGGLLLIIIGLQMIFSALNYSSKEKIPPQGLQILLLGFIISLDSFSVGLSLGISGVRIAIVLLLFGSVSTCLAWLGMLLGRRVRGFLGVYSEMLGGSILCSFGLFYIF